MFSQDLFSLKMEHIKSHTFSFMPIGRNYIKLGELLFYRNKAIYIKTQT